MKTLLCTLILATLGTAAAKADSITIAFDQPNQVGVPGQTFQFFGTITNDSNVTVYLNGDGLNFDDPSLTATDQFFATVPTSLAPVGQPGSSSEDIELFDVTLNNPLLDAGGRYSGSYVLSGGIDGNAQDNLGSANISVTPLSANPVPEPSTVYLVLGGLGTVLAPMSRKICTKTS